MERGRFHVIPLILLPCRLLLLWLNYFLDNICRLEATAKRKISTRLFLALLLVTSLATMLIVPAVLTGSERTWELYYESEEEEEEEWDECDWYNTEKMITDKLWNMNDKKMEKKEKKRIKKQKKMKKKKKKKDGRRSSKRICRICFLEY